MNPTIRIAIVVAALAGVLLIGKAAWPAVASNLTALKSWTRREAVVVTMNDRVEFELGKEGSTPLPPWAPPGMPTDSKRAFAAVEHEWGLRLGGKVPVFVDPADPSRIKTAGVFQMWLFPAAMSGLIVLFLVSALIVVRLGTGQAVAQADGGKAQGL